MELTTWLARARAIAIPAATAAFVLITAFSPREAAALNVDVTNFTLENGMQVLVIPDHRAPVVTHMVWYRVGSADEPQGQAGIAHFLEHLMFKGTKKLKVGEFSRIIKRNGGQENAFTSKDFTAYYQRIAKDRLGLVMRMEADRMVNLVLKDENVIPERAVVEEERRSRIDNDPSSLLSELMNANLYLSHPYRKPVIGWMPEVNRLSREDALAFYKQHYTPKNAILIVAGDVTPEHVKTLALKYYGPLMNTADPGPRVRTVDPEPIAARRVVLRDERVAAPFLQRSYVAPSYTTANAGEAEALDVLAQAIGSGPTSRFYKALVVKQKIASQAGAWYSSDALDGGTFGVYISPVPGKAIEDAEAALNGEVAKVADRGITPDELKRAKNALIASTIYSLDSQFRLAYIFGSALTTGQTVADVTAWSDRIEAVSVEDVKRMAASVLREKRSVTGELLKAPAKSASNAQN